MSGGKMAEYVVGILVPLGVFWAGERGWLRWAGMGNSTPDSARGGSPESEAKRGRCPRFAPPLQDLGQHASCRSGRKSSVRAIRRCRSTLKNRFSNDLHTVGQGVQISSPGNEFHGLHL